MAIALMIGGFLGFCFISAVITLVFVKTVSAIYSIFSNRA